MRLQHFITLSRFSFTTTIAYLKHCLLLKNRTKVKRSTTYKFLMRVQLLLEAGTTLEDVVVQATGIRIKVVVIELDSMLGCLSASGSSSSVKKWKINLKPLRDPGGNKGLLA